MTGREPGPAVAELAARTFCGNWAHAMTTAQAPVLMTLDADEMFFHEHAGSSYHPERETPEHGRAKGAVLLAEAERGLKRAIERGTHDLVWEFDDYQECDATQPGDMCEGGRHDHGPAWCCAVVRLAVPPCSHGHGGKPREFLASLCGIFFATGAGHPLDEPYGRVVAAELAMEAGL